MKFLLVSLLIVTGVVAIPMDWNFVASSEENSGNGELESYPSFDGKEKSLQCSFDVVKKFLICELDHAKTWKDYANLPSLKDCGLDNIKALLGCFMGSHLDEHPNIHEEIAWLFGIDMFEAIYDDSAQQ